MAFYQLQRTKIPPYTPPEDEQLQRSTIPTIPPAGYDYLQRTITPAETPTSYDQPQRDLTPASTLSFGDKYTSEKDPMAQNTINNSIEQNALYLAMIQFFSAYNSILAYRQQFSHLEKARYSHAWEINNGFKLVSSLVPIATVDYIIQAGIFSGREGDMARMEVQRVRDNLQGFLTLASEVFWKIDTENMLKLSLHAPVSAMMRLSASIDQLEKAQARCTAAFTETT